MSENNTEQQVREGLSRLAREAPNASQVWGRVESSLANEGAGMVPATEDPRESRRVRNLVTLVAAASVVAAIAFGVNMVGTSRLGSDHQPGVNPDPAAQGSGQVMENPVEIGRGRAVVSIPSSWQRNAVNCGAASADTVIFATTAGRACMTSPTDHDTLTIGWAEGRDPAGLQRRVVDGNTAYISDPSVHAGLSVIEVLVPTEDARFVISTKSPELALEIASSLRFLPAKETTVPDIYQGSTGGIPGISDTPGPNEVKTRLQNAGLAVQIRFEGDATAKHWSALTTDVESGAILEASTLVTVTYSVGAKSP